MQECITPIGAWLTATTISAAYVASLYVLPKRIRKLHRDHPRLIYGRFDAEATRVRHARVERDREH